MSFRILFLWVYSTGTVTQCGCLWPCCPWGRPHSNIRVRSPAHQTVLPSGARSPASWPPESAPETQTRGHRREGLAWGGCDPRMLGGSVSPCHGPRPSVTGHPGGPFPPETLHLTPVPSLSWGPDPGPGQSELRGPHPQGLNSLGGH